ncbi:hypothetical protein BASA81_005364 [Batrachochytrium salamandrivorans]|nr:hypothetical protein BASA81_005364 [Batrachochytrium salamandrivorans]
MERAPKRHRVEIPRLTVVLDLDETLIHSEVVDLDLEEHACPNSFYVTLDEFTKAGKKLLVRKRPFVHQFLLQASQLYDLVLFTAGVEPYAKAVISKLDVDGSLFKRLLFRPQCEVLENDQYCKNLLVVDSNLERIVLVDNSPQSFAKTQLGNGLLIPSFFRNDQDFALVRLAQLLGFLNQQHDVRFALPHMAKLERIVNMPVNIAL